MLTLIVNPIAGHGLAKVTHEKLLQFLEERKLPHRSLVTAAPGDAENFARDLAAQARGEDAVILGGDGTVNEVVNALAGSNVTCYFVPCGTGNDFAKALALPADPLEAFAAQLAAPPARVDLGRMNQRIFANVSGAGFDVEVLRQTQRFKNWGRGLLPYLLGTCAAIRRFAPMAVRISMDGAPEQDMLLTIISIGNGQYIGGGMKAVPNAKVDDGLFDVIAIDALKSRWQIVRLLPKFIQGQHLSLPQVRVFRCRSLRIRSAGMTINLDGELLPCDSAEYELLAGALQVRRPRPEAR